MPVLMCIVVVVGRGHVCQRSSVDAVMFGVEAQAVLVVGADGVPLRVDHPNAAVGIIFERGVHTRPICHETGGMPTKASLMSAHTVADVHANMLSW